MKTISTNLDNFKNSREHEIILLYCSRCGHRFHGSELYTGTCPKCGTTFPDPLSSHNPEWETCCTCSKHRHYPKCCTSYGQDAPHLNDPPGWGMSAANCAEYSPRSPEVSNPTYTCIICGHGIEPNDVCYYQVRASIKKGKKILCGDCTDKENTYTFRKFVAKTGGVG